MERPEQIYLSESIDLSGTKVNHTPEGLKYLIEHYQHILSFPVNDAKLKSADRQHIEKMIINYTFHLQLYEHDKNRRAEAEREHNVLPDHQKDDIGKERESESVASVHDSGHGGQSQ